MATGDEVTIDHDVCFMSGECVLAAPEVYEFNDEGYPVIKEGAVERAPTELLVSTAENCPSGAISYGRKD